MKHLLPLALFLSFILIEMGCKKGIDDSIDCIVESAFLEINDSTDQNNPKLVYFEFVNTDTEGGFSLDNTIAWDFGDGSTATSTNHKIDHTYTNSGDFTVKGSYTLRRGDATCSSSKQTTVTVN